MKFSWILFNKGRLAIPLKNFLILVFFYISVNVEMYHGVESRSDVMELIPSSCSILMSPEMY